MNVAALRVARAEGPLCRLSTTKPPQGGLGSAYGRRDASRTSCGLRGLAGAQVGVRATETLGRLASGTVCLSRSFKSRLPPLRFLPASGTTPRFNRRRRLDVLERGRPLRAVTDRFRPAGTQRTAPVALALQKRRRRWPPHAPHSLDCTDIRKPGGSAYNRY